MTTDSNPINLSVFNFYFANEKFPIAPVVAISQIGVASFFDSIGCRIGHVMSHVSEDISTNKEIIPKKW